MACGLIVLGLLTLALPSGTAQDAGRGLAQRATAIEQLLVQFSRNGNTVIITGANLQIVNGVGQTSCEDNLGNPIPGGPNGLGNLLVGYNEPRDPSFPGVPGETIRTGSHNVVVGRFPNFAGVGGLVAGELNEIPGDFTVVSGGQQSTASGRFAAVGGGVHNLASGHEAWATGGQFNTASGHGASVSAGASNTARGFYSAVSAGPRTRRAGRAPPSAAGCSGPLQD